MGKDIAKVWTFESSSSSAKYETLQYTDGSTSCNCPGWTKRAIRSCKHTRMVDQGIADSECVAHKDYASKAPAKKTATKIAAKDTTSVIEDFAKKSKLHDDDCEGIVRKIEW